LRFEDGRGVAPAHEAAIRAALEAVEIGFPFEIAAGQGRPAGVTYSPPDRKNAHTLFRPLPEDAAPLWTAIRRTRQACTADSNVDWGKYGHILASRQRRRQSAGA